MTNTVQSHTNAEHRTYTYRWLILAMFGLLMGLSAFQVNQFTVIENVIKSYYGTTHTLVNFTSLAFMSTLIIFLVPAIYFLGRFDLKHALVFSAGMNCLGNLLKLLALSPDKFYIILIAQLVCGIAQVFLIILPSQIVAVWCSAEEQNKASGFTTWGSAIGGTLAGTLPVWMLENAKTNDETHDQLSLLFIGNAVVSCIMFAAILILFRSKPPTPPSVQQSALVNAKINHRQALSQLWNNKEFLKLTCIFNVLISCPVIFSMLQNELYLEAFKNSMGDIAQINLITTVLGSIIGTVIIGYLLDRSHKYKLMTSGVSLLIALGYGLLATFILLRMHTCAFISNCIFGFFAGPALNVGYQYIAEVSYPVSESTTIGVLYLTTSLVIIVINQIFNILVDAKNYAVIHIILFTIFVLNFLGTFFLSPNLKRMLVNAKGAEIKT